MKWCQHLKFSLKMDDIESQIYEWAKSYAEKESLKLNPDYDIVAQAIKGLAQNKRKYGM